MNYSRGVIVGRQVSSYANVFDGLVRTSGDLRFVVDSVEALRIDGVIVVSDLIEDSVSVFGPFFQNNASCKQK